MVPHSIREEKHIHEYLIARGLLSQYKKAKIHILSGLNTKTYFQERLPKGYGAWYFRINKKYRAVGEFQGDVFLVGYIDDHQ